MMELTNNKIELEVETANCFAEGLDVGAESGGGFENTLELMVMK